MSATRGLGQNLLEMNAIECSGGLLRKAKMCFGSLTVRMPLGSMDVKWQQLVAAESKSGLVLLAEA